MTLSQGMSLAIIQEWCNRLCMILNPNKTKALVVSRSRTVNPPHSDLVLSGVSICASPNLDIPGVKVDSRLTFEYHACSIASRASQSIAILILVKPVFVDTELRCFVATLHLFSQSLSIVFQCGDLLLNGIFSYASPRSIRWPGLAMIRLSCHCVIDVMLMHCVCCTRLIRTRIIVVR